MPREETLRPGMAPAYTKGMMTKDEAMAGTVAELVHRVQFACSAFGRSVHAGIADRTIANWCERMRALGMPEENIAKVAERARLSV